LVYIDHEFSLLVMTVREEYADVKTLTLKCEEISTEAAWTATLVGSCFNETAFWKLGFRIVCYFNSGKFDGCKPTTGYSPNLTASLRRPELFQSP